MILFEPADLPNAEFDAAEGSSTIKPAAAPARMLHLAYDGGRHYDSVRMLDDFGKGPPKPLVLIPEIASPDGKQVSVRGCLCVGYV